MAVDEYKGETCSVWERNWAAAMPDRVVQKAIRKGVVKPRCLPKERLERMGYKV